MDKYKLLYNIRGQYDPGVSFVRANDRTEASAIGETLYGEDFRVALKIIAVKVKNKPKIIIK